MFVYLGRFSSLTYLPGGGAVLLHQLLYPQCWCCDLCNDLSTFYHIIITILRHSQLHLTLISDKVSAASFHPQNQQ